MSDRAIAFSFSSRPVKPCQVSILAGQIRHDLLGVRADEIEVLKDKSKDHEERIRKLERDLVAA